MALTHSIHCVMYGCESDISFRQDSGGFLCGVHNKSATLSFDQHIFNGIVQSITFSECNSYIMRYPWIFTKHLLCFESYIRIHIVKASFGFLLYYCLGYYSSLQNYSMWSNFSHATMIKHWTTYENWISCRCAMTLKWISAMKHYFPYSDISVGFSNKRILWFE